MKKQLIFGLVFSMLIALSFATSGCRSTHRSRTIFSGDHNVTVAKTQRKGVKGRKRVVRTKKYNRAR